MLVLWHHFFRATTGTKRKLVLFRANQINSRKIHPFTQPSKSVAFADPELGKFHPELCKTNLVCFVYLRSTHLLEKLSSWKFSVGCINGRGVSSRVHSRQRHFARRTALGTIRHPACESNTGSDGRETPSSSPGIQRSNTPAVVGAVAELGPKRRRQWQNASQSAWGSALQSLKADEEPRAFEPGRGWPRYCVVRGFTEADLANLEAEGSDLGTMGNSMTVSWRDHW